MDKLTYQDGYIAGEYDGFAHAPLAWLFDNGSLQSDEWKRGYEDGKTDARERRVA